jgi:hypothetical protein
MATNVHEAKFTSVILNPKGQNLESVHRVVAAILGRAGCSTCGRAAVLRVDFLGDPLPEFGKENVISLVEGIVGR